MDEIKRQDGTQERSIYAVESEQYGKFLCELFDLWYADFAAGEAMDIRMFSNLAQMAAGYPAEECGMNGCCNCYFVVEGDGSVDPCDFYCMDEWKLGTVNDGFVQMKTSEKAKAFVEASRPVSYTHLDVYKRQGNNNTGRCGNGNIQNYRSHTFKQTVSGG